jgi:DNA-binding transcriptional ArsR family regulator
MTERPALGVDENVRVLDADTLKGLAHPLRVQIFDLLAIHGPHTASGAAERVGESSGVTSYHLRQLAKHGLVREVEGRGTARERWWERVPGAIAIVPAEDDASPAERAASSTLVRHWEQSRSQLLGAFLARGELELSKRWLLASAVSWANMRLTVEQLEALSTAWEAFSAEHLEPLRGQNLPGSRPVQIQFNAFPVIDGEPTPMGDTDDGRSDR